MPGLISSQGARGAWKSSATKQKVGRLTEDTGDSLTDLATAGARAQSQLSVNALLAQTGISI